MSIYWTIPLNQLEDMLFHPSIIRQAGKNDYAKIRTIYLYRITMTKEELKYLKKNKTILKGRGETE